MKIKGGYQILEGFVHEINIMNDGTPETFTIEQLKNNDEKDMLHILEILDNIFENSSHLDSDPVIALRQSMFKPIYLKLVSGASDASFTGWCSMTINRGEQKIEIKGLSNSDLQYLPLIDIEYTYKQSVTIIGRLAELQ